MKNLRQPQFTIFILFVFMFILAMLVVFDNQGIKDSREHNQIVEEINIEANKARNDKFCELYIQKVNNATKAPPAYKYCFKESYDQPNN